MRSTGEVLGLGEDLQTAMHKALVSAGISLNSSDRVLATSNGELTPILERLQANGVEVEICKDYPLNQKRLKNGEFNLLVAPDKTREDFLLRRQAVEYGIPTISSPDTLKAVLDGMQATLKAPLSLNEYLGGIAND